jgi:hypothetical protein
VRISAVRLPDVQRFACSRRAVKELFDQDLDWVSFGSVASHFRFDSHCDHRPRLTGVVVASMAVTRYQSKCLCLYPVARAGYSEGAVSEFTASVLPQLRDWLTAMLQRPETGILGHEKMIVEWVDGGHRLHQVRYW